MDETWSCTVVDNTDQLIEKMVIGMEKLKTIRGRIISFPSSSTGVLHADICDARDALSKVMAEIMEWTSNIGKDY